MSCKGDKSNKQKNEIADLIGRELYVSNKIKSELSNFEKNILIYVAKEDCTECQLSLPQWKHKMKELRQSHTNVGILFIVSTVDSTKINHLFQKEDLNIPLFFDNEEIFLSANKISRESNNLHTFLLDNENKIILVGSPIYNDKMWNLYKKVLLND